MSSQSSHHSPPTNLNISALTPLLGMAERPSTRPQETPAQSSQALHQINVVPSPPQILPVHRAHIGSRDASSPVRLFFQDAAVFGHIMPMLPYALLPRNAKDDGDVLLASSWRGKRDQFLILAISVAQAFVFPVILLGWCVAPGLVWLLVGGFLQVLMHLVLKITQGPRFVNSKVPLENETYEYPLHSRERWIFINGIMTGHIGLQSAVDGLARVFRRPILGIHNETSGFFGDIFECLIQRCFSYDTKDVRVAYDRLYGVLRDPDVDKVVLVAHSQGGIIASLCIDYLFTKLPTEDMAKLEVYTFGSAASHFNNPTCGSLPGKRTHAPSPSPPVSPGKFPDPSCPHHVIRYIEHYANSLDPIPRWGVLHSVYALLSPRYSGTLFVRLGASGHLFTSHYLASWFPVDVAEADLIGSQIIGVEHSVLRGRATGLDAGQVNGKVNQNGEIQVAGGIAGEGDFDGSANPQEPGTSGIVARASTMEWGDKRPAGMKLLDEVEKARKALEEGQLNFVDARGEGYSGRMKELSRLWAYVDGRSPAD